MGQVDTNPMVVQLIARQQCVVTEKGLLIFALLKWMKVRSVRSMELEEGSPVPLVTRASL